MKSTGLNRSSSAGLSRSGLLALLLVGALLLCHGVFSALHLCSAPQVFANQAHEHHLSFTEMGAVDHEHPGCHLMGATDYFAVLLTTLGLVLGLLLKGTRLWGGVVASRAFEREFRPLVFHPPRGPTLLQVLRL